MRLDGSSPATARPMLSAALTLSLVTGRPFRIVNFRRAAYDPGFTNVDVALINAISRLGSAHVHGSLVGSRQLEFRPTRFEPRDLSIDLGSPGPAPRLAQMLHLPLALKGRRASRLIVRGDLIPLEGPSFTNLKETWSGHLARLGSTVVLGIPQSKIASDPAGILDAWIEPADLRPVRWTTRGPLVTLRGVVEFCNLSQAVAERLKAVVESRLRREGFDVQIELFERSGSSSGAAVHLIAAHDNGAEGPASATFTGIVGGPKSPEDGADEAVDAFLAFTRTRNAAVDPVAASSLALVLAFAEGRSEFTVSAVSRELRILLPTLRAFLPERVITLAEAVGDLAPARVVIA